MFVKPELGVSDNSNPGGAVAIMSDVKAFPKIEIRWINGLTDGEPTHAEITPVAEPALIYVCADDGLTVILSVTGAQPVPPEIKFPIEIGADPTVTVPVTKLVEVLIIETLLLTIPATYTLLPSGLADKPAG